MVSSKGDGTFGFATNRKPNEFQVCRLGFSFWLNGPFKQNADFLPVKEACRFYEQIFKHKLKS